MRLTCEAAENSTTSGAYGCSDGIREFGLNGEYREIVRPHRILHAERFDQAWYAGAMQSLHD